MAKNTVNRQPISIPITSDKDTFFNQTQFNGICDNKNHTNIDQLTFSAAENVYVNSGNILASRSPFKHKDTDTNIIERRIFGDYDLRLHRFLEDAEGNIITNPSTYEPAQLRFKFSLTCTSRGGQLLDTKDWIISFVTLGWHTFPAVAMTQIEDKIYVWFNNEDFICFNVKTSLFEDATKYLYVPVAQLVLNGFVNDLEDKNYLTTTYRKRYQYSEVSTVNFDKLIGKNLEVNLNGEATEKKTKFLYDVTVQRNQKDVLIYPYSTMGDNYYVDIVQTARANVTLRYSAATGTIEISFDAKTFRQLPYIEGIIGNPVLSRDGLYVVVFTKTTLAKIKLVAQESTDFTDDTNVLEWEYFGYFANNITDGAFAPIDSIDDTFVPSGHFETIDQFTYVFSANGMRNVYYEWLSGVEGKVWGTYQLGDKLKSDDLRITMRYVPVLSEAQTLRGVVSLLTDSYEALNSDLTLISIGVERGEKLRDLTLRNDDLIYLSNSTLTDKYITRLTADGMNVSVGDSNIYGNDVVLLSDIPLYASITDDWDSAREYYVGDVVTSSAGANLPYLYKCKKKNTNMPVTNTTYWEHIKSKTGSDYLSYSLFSYFNDTGTATYDARLPWRTALLMGRTNVVFMGDIADNDRCIIGNLKNTIEPIELGNITTIRSVNFDIAYTADDLERIFGPFPYATNDPNKTTWADLYKKAGNYGGIVQKVIQTRQPPYDFRSALGIKNISNPLFVIPENVVITYPTSYNGAKRGDNLMKDAYLSLFAPEVTSTTVLVHTVVGTNAVLRTSAKKDAFTKVSYVYGRQTVQRNALLDIDGNSSKFVGIKDIETVLTNKYLFAQSSTVDLPAIPNLKNPIRPISIGADGAWLNVEGDLWTSQPKDGNFLDLDEYINGSKNTTAKPVGVPTHTATLSEHYFTYSTADNRNLLEVTSTRRDENKLFSEDGTDLLLYLPKLNEQQFAEKITNLHPISETIMGVFTENNIWYVTTVDTTSLGTVYTKATKSKIPVGCRNNDDVITALDGQVIIFPTQRGITAMAPQDFVATTERTLSYLSDNITQLYEKFYNDVVENATLFLQENKSYSPEIKIRVSTFWLMFYKKMSKNILLFDTRNNSWWSWTVPYPIIDITTEYGVQLLLQIDYNPVVNGKVGPMPPKAPLMGNIFSLYMTDDNENYYDDLIDGALSGEYYSLYDNSFVGSSTIVKYPSSIIPWFFSSQKLHFGAINNYKHVKAINISANGEDEIIAKMSTKTYRDFYHPEKSTSVEIKINDLRTFVHRINIMQAVYFEHKFENDGQYKLRLNSLSIKYGIKGRVR